MDWSNLTISPPKEEIGRAYSLWPSLAGVRLKPLMISSFGSMFFVTEEPGVKLLDLVELRIMELDFAESDFTSFINKPENINVYLMSWLVAEILEKGIQKGNNQIYGFAPHPCFTGKCSTEFVMPMDLLPYLAICEQLQLREPELTDD